MKNLDMTTHIESLDSQRVVVPDLDVDGALINTVARGKKIARDRMITKALQFSAVFAVVFLAGAGAMRMLVDAPAKSVAVKKSEKVATKVLGKQETNTSVAVTVPEQTPETTAPPQAGPTTISFGDPIACAMSTGPGQDGIDIGSSQSAEMWSPTINETKTISTGENGKQIILKNVTNPEAPTGQSVTLAGNVDRADAFADINATTFMYCSSGYSLAIRQESNGSYLLTTEIR